MRIVYVAKHNSGGNDDEGAISHALEVLGHKVTKVQERRAKFVRFPEADLCLFHKWDDPSYLYRLQGRMKTAFWYFDLVDFSDLTIEHRNAQRREWMYRITPLVTIGFCTDGDWVVNDQSGKLHYLPQGADERVIGVEYHPKTIDILFTGLRKRAGAGRESFVAEMENRWGQRFVHVASGVYREQMRQLIGTSRVVVAPDAPVTDNYCSNRAFNALGFGAILFHPKCRSLQDCYPHGVGPLWYSCREDLHGMLAEFFNMGEKDYDDVRRMVCGATTEMNLYRHRCEQLIRMVEATHV